MLSRCGVELSLTSIYDNNRPTIPLGSPMGWCLSGGGVGDDEEKRLSRTTGLRNGLNFSTN